MTLNRDGDETLSNVQNHSSEILAESAEWMHRSHIKHYESIGHEHMHPRLKALGAGKDTLARQYVSLASTSKAPSLNLQSLFTGTDGS